MWSLPRKQSYRKCLNNILYKAGIKNAIEYCETSKRAKKIYYKNFESTSHEAKRMDRLTCRHHIGEDGA